MKKRGFTLAEILMTLGIVGVVAALAGPAMINIMPDKQKAMFLKNYKELSVITKNLLEDETIYPPCLTYDNKQKVDEKRLGLACTTTPLRTPYNVKVNNNYLYTGNQKYPYLLAHNLGIDKPQDLNWTDAGGITFRTSDNTRWVIDVNTTNLNVIESYSVSIIIDDENHACIYGAQNCARPSMYSLLVSKSGIVSGDDSLSKAYLLNNTRLNNRKIDLECAAAIEAGNTCD